MVYFGKVSGDIWTCAQERYASGKRDLFAWEIWQGYLRKIKCNPSLSHLISTKSTLGNTERTCEWIDVWTHASL